MIGLFEKLPPVEKQAVKPWRLTTGLEFICVLVAVFHFVHCSEAGEVKVRKVVTECTSVRFLRRHFADVSFGE